MSGDFLTPEEHDGDDGYGDGDTDDDGAGGAGDMGTQLSTAICRLSFYSNFHMFVITARRHKHAQFISTCFVVKSKRNLVDCPYKYRIFNYFKTAFSTLSPDVRHHIITNTKPKFR